MTPEQPQRRMRAVGAPVAKKKAAAATVGKTSVGVGAKEEKLGSKKLSSVVAASAAASGSGSRPSRPAEVIKVDSDTEEEDDMEEVEVPGAQGGGNEETDDDALMTDATTASRPKTPGGALSSAPSTPRPAAQEEPDEEEEFDAEAAYGYDFSQEDTQGEQVAVAEPSGRDIMVNLGVDAEGLTPEERRRREIIANRKKPLTARDRALRLQAHKLHILALLASGAVRNRWATDDLLKARLLSLTPNELHTAFHIPPSRYPDVVHRSRLFQAALQELASWWANEFFEVSDNTIGIRTKGWDEINDIVDNLPRIKNKKMMEIIVLSDGESQPVQAGSSTGPGTKAGASASSSAKAAKAVKAQIKAAQKAAKKREEEEEENFLSKLGSGGERLRTVKSLMKKALQGAGGRDTSAQLFVSLCRSMGLGARLVVSLQPVQWKADKGQATKPAPKLVPQADPRQALVNQARSNVNETQSRTAARRKGKMPDKTQSEEDEEDDMEEVAIPGVTTSARQQPSTKSRTGQLARSAATSAAGSDADGDSDATNKAGWVNPRLNPRTADMENRYKLRKTQAPKLGTAAQDAKRKKKNEDLSNHPPVFWAEVYCRPDQKWIPIDPVRGVIKRKKDFEPTSDTGPIRMTYVVAFEEDGYARDVTVRYAQNFGAKTVKMRVPVSKDGPDWWENVIGMLKRPYRLNRDDLEDAELETSQVSEGMPMVLNGFKDHPIYVLERHLKREEVIIPKREVGRFRGEAVYRRANVVSCKTPENWMRTGRKIKDKEEPLKWVKQRAVTIDKRRAQELAEIEGHEPMQQGLFAEYQTELYKAPPIRKGIIPTNTFGNVDLYVPTMLPAGGAHLPYKGIAKVAKQLRISYAEACTGFEFKKQRAIPVITGIVVPIEHEEALMEAYRESAAAAEERALNKKQEAALRRWKKLLRSMEIKARLEDQYGSGSGSGLAAGRAGVAGSAVSQANSNAQAAYAAAISSTTPKKKIRPTGAARLSVPAAAVATPASTSAAAAPTSSDSPATPRSLKLTLRVGSAAPSSPGPPSVKAQDFASAEGGEGGGFVVDVDEDEAMPEASGSGLGSGSGSRSRSKRTATREVVDLAGSDDELTPEEESEEEEEEEEEEAFEPEPVVAASTRSSRTRSSASGAAATKASKSKKTAAPKVKAAQKKKTRAAASAKVEAVGTRRSTRAAASKGREKMREVAGDEDESEEEEDEEME